MKRESLILSLTFAFALATAPSFAENKMQQGVRLYNAKQYKEAAQALDEYLSQNPKDSYAAYYAALSYQQSGNMNKARQYYRVTATVAPDSQIGGYAKNILIKMDPTFASSQSGASTTSASSSAGSGSASSGTSGSASSAPAIDPRLPKECDIRCEKEHGAIFVNTYINGRAIRMVFDTGAPTVVIGKNQLEEAGLQAPRGAFYGQSGGSSNSTTINFWVMNATVKAGSLERTIPIKVLETNAADPLLGQNFFREFEYTIDQSGGNIHLRLKGAGGGESIRNAYSVPFEFNQKAGDRVVVNVEVNGKSGPFMFDTGNSANAIKFHTVKQAEAYGVRVPDDAATTTNFGVSGAGKVKVFTVNRARLGPIDRTNVDCAVGEDGVDGVLPLLGEPFWQSYQYTIDRPNKKIHFVRR